MSKVKKVVVFSDLHLGKEGEDGCYLYSENPNYPSNKKSVINLLQEVGETDEIILNGDVFELALCGLNVAYSEVKKFFELLAESGPVKKIVFLPGNHDHHLWRVVGEQIHVDGKVKKGKSPPDNDQYPASFVDQQYSSNDPTYSPGIILSHLWPKKKGKKIPEFVVKYPHHLLEIPGKDNKVEHYLVTHGHFLEPLFKPVNYLIDPKYLAELEAFNCLWLEAFDYYLGHSGRLADYVRKLEHDFTRGGKKAKKRVKDISNALYINLKKKIGFKFPVSCIVKIALRLIIKKVPTEKSGKARLRGEHLNENLKTSIKEYICKYILQRYKEENKEELNLPIEKDIPTPFTFVFGHTHEPFDEKEMEEAFVKIKEKRYPLINSGGWLRSDGNRSGNGQCAGVVVIDENGAKWKSLAGKLQ